MAVWVALLRGVNVGGHHSLPSKDLVRVLEELGASDVRTYLQSGNAVFRSPARGAAKLGREVAAGVLARRGFEPEVQAWSRAELERVAERNPYAAEAEVEPKSVHVWFAAARIPRAGAAELEALRAPTERFTLAERALYLHTPDGLGRSKLAARAEKALGVPLTARNARTVAALVDLARELA